MEYIPHQFLYQSSTFLRPGTLLQTLKDREKPGKYDECSSIFWKWQHHVCGEKPGKYDECSSIFWKWQHHV
jgi:hypothetical protein